MPRLHATPTEIEKHVALLAQTPARIAASTAGVAADGLAQPPGPKAWSPVEVLAHLRACDDLWSHSIYAMLAENLPALALLDERRWARAARYASLSFAVSFQVFQLKRAELLRVLRGLPPEGWLRAATIGGRTHTVFSQVRRMALHEQEHCAQLDLMLK